MAQDIYSCGAGCLGVGVDLIDDAPGVEEVRLREQGCGLHIHVSGPGRLPIWRLILGRLLREGGRERLTRQHEGRLVEVFQVQTIKLSAPDLNA